jgi:hypothetical protein
MTTEKFDLPTTGYSVQGWDAIITAAIEAIDAAIPSRELVTLGETVTAYQAACFSAEDSKWYKAKADGVLQPCHGLFLEGGDEDDEVRIHRMGVVINAGWEWASLGDPIYVDPDTAGALTQTPPAANKQIVGYAISATSMLALSLPRMIMAETQISDPVADNDFLVGEDDPLGWAKKTLEETQTILGIGAPFDAPAADSDFLVGQDDPLSWVKKTLAETQSILGIGGSYDAPAADNDMLFGQDDPLKWEKKTLAEGKAILGIDYQTMWIPANAMTPTDTNGAEMGTTEYAANDINMDYLAFDGTTEEFAEFQLPMPENWDRSTIKAKCFWSSATGSTAGDTVEWELQGGALSDDDAIDAALGTAQVISDTLLADNGTDLQVSAATPAITVGGTPALGDLVHFKVSRNVGGTDDMEEDAWLFGVWIQYKCTNAVAAW